MHLRCPELLCFILKGQETGKGRIERQTQAKFAAYFLGNKPGFLKANKTQTCTYKLAWQKKSCLCLDFQLHDPIVSFRHFRCFTSWKPIVQTYGEGNIPDVNAKPANILCHHYCCRAVIPAFWEPGCCVTKCH